MDRPMKTAFVTPTGSSITRRIEVITCGDTDNERHTATGIASEQPKIANKRIASLRLIDI
jgi:hypothetical protein